MRYAIFLLLAAAATAPAQLFTYGIKAGVPVTEALPHADPGLDTGRWTIGPTVEVHVFRGLSVEFDALYRGYRYNQNSLFALTLTGQATAVTAVSSYQQDTKVWELPLLLKYRFNAGRFRPFVDAGASFTHESSDTKASLLCPGSIDLCSSSVLLTPGVHRSTFGANYGSPVAGAGVEFKAGKRLHISPEVRYSRRNSPGINNVSLLVGLTF